MNLKHLFKYFKNKAICSKLQIWVSITMIFLILMSSCKVQKTANRSQLGKLIENSLIFKNYHMGFSLMDSQNGEMIYESNSHKYFTPASNAKLFTFYTCLRVLGDSIPSFKYSIINDSLFFTGTGDPSFLHPEFDTQPAYNYLKERNEKLVYVNKQFHDEAYGPGWSWDDYHYAFSAEKAPFPIYGNYVNFIYRPLEVYPDVLPAYFEKFSRTLETDRRYNRNIRRDFLGNVFSFQIRTDTVGDTVKIPFKYSTELLIELLSDTLRKPVHLAKNINLELDKVFYGTAADSLYKEMLWESDNFIAEQLLLICAATLSDTLQVQKTIEYAKEHFLYDMEDDIKWVDGSGLSRYNLMTPHSMVYILKKIYELVPESRLFELMPVGGVTGNLKRWYKAEIPYVIAKTGTLSNVHCLSGYVKTRSGKVMIFSFMHNNFVNPTNSIRYEMEKVLKQIYLEF